MASLAEAEKQLTHATTEAVSSPALEHASLIRDAAEAVALAGRGALAWLAENPGPNAAVNVAMKQGWTAYEAAATTMIDMCTGSVSMTPENGELARAAIEVAQRENWEAGLLDRRTRTTTVHLASLVDLESAHESHGASEGLRSM